MSRPCRAQKYFRFLLFIAVFYFVPQKFLEAEIARGSLFSIEVQNELKAILPANLLKKIDNANPTVLEIESLLSELHYFNFLCEHEIEYFKKKNLRKISPSSSQNVRAAVMRKIGKRIVFHHKEAEYILKNVPIAGKGLTFYNGTRIEGSTVKGGLQPTYIVDSRHSLLKEVIAKARRAMGEGTLEEQIKNVSDYIAFEVFEPTSYEDPLYLDLMRQFRETGRDIPVSEYLKIKKGTCREVAIVTQLVFQELGFESEYLYARVVTTRLNEVPVAEPHAFNLVRIDGKEVIIDNYFSQFHMKLLSDLYEGVDAEIGHRNVQACFGLGKAQMIKINSYPNVFHHPKHF